MPLPLSLSLSPPTSIIGPLPSTGSLCCGEGLLGFLDHFGFRDCEGSGDGAAALNEGKGVEEGRPPPPTGGRGVVEGRPPLPPPGETGVEDGGPSSEGRGVGVLVGLTHRGLRETETEAEIDADADAETEGDAEAEEDAEEDAEVETEVDGETETDEDGVPVD